MKLLLVYFSVAILGVTVVVAAILLLPDTEANLSNLHRTSSTLITGQISNFTLLAKAKPTPEIHFSIGDSKRLTLEDFHGKVVLVNLWATWCNPCIREMPSLDRLQAELGGSNFDVIAISQDSKGLEIVAPFFQDHGLRHLRIYLDSSNQTPRKLGVRGLPTSILINHSGNEVGRLIGPAEWDSPEAISLIRHFINVMKP